jgi:hypothetical protein
LEKKPWSVRIHQHNMCVRTANGTVFKTLNGFCKCHIEASENGTAGSPSYLFPIPSHVHTVCINKPCRSGIMITVLSHYL